MLMHMFNISATYLLKLALNSLTPYFFVDGACNLFLHSCRDRLTGNLHHINGYPAILALNLREHNTKLQFENFLSNLKT